MKLIGLTGGIGTGKSTVSEYLIELGYKVIDADKISREIVEPNSETLNKIAKEFGDEILLQDGSLNRKKLADIVFSDPDKKALLDSIMHTKIIDIIIERAKSYDNEKFVFLDVPLLYETNMDELVDMVWVVDADEETRINRIMIRDKLTREQAIDRINNQMSQSEKVKKADYVIDNSGDKYTLYNQINNILNLIEESEQ
ncbi:MAG: dephospho-CoA kinase [Clostridiales bacterium]|nr:dephospho-CoA kinase [Clostridiales bacterium]